MKRAILVLLASGVLGAAGLALVLAFIGMVY